MIKKVALLTGVVLLLTTPAWAQSSILQTGNPIRGHIPVWTDNGIQGDSGSRSVPGNPPATDLSLVGVGKPLCIYDTIPTGLVTYHELCFGHNTSGSPILSVDGVDYTFPWGGGGNVLGPGSSAVNEIASFNNTTGALLRQGPAQITDSKTAAITADNAAITGLSQTGTPAQTVYNQAVFSGVATTFNGYDSLRGVAVAPALSTVNTITGVAGYTLSNTVPIGQRSQTVALFGVGVCAVNNSQCWGVDTIVSDNPNLANTGVTAGVGKFLTNEFDLNVTSPNTSGNGLAIGGTALPAAVTLGINGVAVNKLWGAGGAGTGTSLFANGFITGDACCATGVNIGASALSGASKASQPLTLNYFDAGSVYRNVTLTALGNQLVLGGTVAAGYATANSNGTVNGLSLGAQAAAGATINSQFILLNYRDGAAAPQNASIVVAPGARAQTILSTSATIMDYQISKGGLITANAATTANGLSVGAQNTAGVNIVSQFALWNYFDAGAVAQNYNMQVNATRTFVFAASVGSGTAKFDFEGGLQIQGSGVQVGAPTGGDKGAGTLNIQNTIWTNGTQGVAAKTCTVNQALTLIFTNGILTGGTCNA